MTAITIYTDASFANGAAGYAALLITFFQNGRIDRFRVVSEAGTFDGSDQAEIAAAMLALRSLQGQHQIQIFSDSKSLVEIMTGMGTPRKNPGMIAELRSQCEEHEICWQWVRGHDGAPYPVIS